MPSESPSPVVLAGYRGLTREAYTLDLRQFTTWCRRAGPWPCSPSAARTSRASPGTWKPGAGPAPRSPGGCPPSPGSTGTRSRKNSPAARRPRTCAGRGRTTGARAAALDRNELGALLVAAGLGPPGRARADLAAGAERAAGLGGHRRGHRAPGPGARAPDADDHPHYQGGRIVTIPLAPRTARAIDLAVGERAAARCSWPRTAGGWTGTQPTSSPLTSQAPPGNPRVLERRRLTAGARRRRIAVIRHGPQPQTCARTAMRVVPARGIAVRARVRIGQYVWSDPEGE